MTIIKHHLIPSVFSVLLTLTCGQLSADEIVHDKLGKQIDEHLQTLAEKGFSGVMFIARDGRVIISKGYGKSNEANGRDYDPATVFDVGSITKQFTAAAILHLEMNGRLKTEDKIGKYFDNVPPDKQEMTLHHLLTHTSGLRDIFGFDYQPASRDWIVDKAITFQLKSKPGEKYRYSNAGYSLLGVIIEIVTGESYEKYLHENLFKPLGMMQTGYRIPKWDESLLAHGYLKSGEDWGTPLDKRWDSDGPYWNLRANGGILSTVGDLYKWHVALQGNEILSEAARKKLFTPHVAEGPRSRSFYGYGWVVVKTPWDTNLITHNGGNGIFFADFRRYVDENTVFIIASNKANHSASRYERGILNILFPKK